MLSVCLVACLALVQQDQDRPTYRLDAKTEAVDGIRRTERTTYSYYWVFRGQERELWRVSLDEKYDNHWIDREGNVWVLASGRMRGVRPGTFGDAKPLPDELWIRDTGARELGFIQISQALNAVAREGEQVSAISGLDTEASRLVQMSPFKTRLILSFGGDNELHVNRIFDSQHGHRSLCYWHKSGEYNALEKVIDSESPIDTTSPVPGRDDIEYWSSSPGGTKGVLVKYVSWPMEAPNTIRLVESQAAMPSPDHVRVTPNNRILWFSFGGLTRSQATIDVMDLSTRRIGQVDFVKGGMFEHGSRAEQELDYTRLSLKRGSHWIDLDRVANGQYDRAEVIGFYDSKNRFYQLTVPPYTDKEGEVRIERALASVKDLRKEPDYVNFKRTDEQIWKSNDGTFAYRIRRFKNDAGREIAQQTFLRHGQNGLEHEYWSKNLYSHVIDAFVTDEGRALVITSGEIKNATTDTMNQFAHLEMWDYQGRGLAYNLADKSFFGSLAAARSARFTEMTVQFEGDVRKEEFEGDDLLLHPTEVYTWKTADGTVVRFSLDTRSPWGFPSLRFIK